jgi:hypothetical protein
MYRNPERQPLLDLHPPYPQNVTNPQRDCSTGYKLPQLSSSSKDEIPRYGLQTPPEDDMGTAYQNPHYGSYASRPDVSFQPSNRTSSHNASYSISSTHTRSSSTLSQPPMNSREVGSTRTDAFTSQNSYSHPASPQSSNRQESQHQQARSGVNDQIMANLQIPKSINSSGGSLAEFAAQVCC